MQRVTAADFMARSEMTLSPELDIYEALRQLIKRKLTGAPVVDQSGVLTGMLTEKDCLKVVISGAMDGVPGGRVSDYMSTPVESISPSAALYDVVQLFLTRSFRKLPVVDDDGRVIGQVSRRDALIAIESIADNSYLYGTADRRPKDDGGVDSAMKIARGQK